MIFGWKFLKSSERRKKFFANNDSCDPERLEKECLQKNDPFDPRTKEKAV